MALAIQKGAFLSSQASDEPRYCEAFQEQYADEILLMINLIRKI